jgi:Protein of unknown function (DUF1592)/Protein of unknown function (DUF1588)/Protein of unknown function (DUF1587)/Protein of unknown function (DUF1595)/Protein of unknown function (DUF1585)
MIVAFRSAKVALLLRSKRRLLLRPFLDPSSVPRLDIATRKLNLMKQMNSMLCRTSIFLLAGLSIPVWGLAQTADSPTTSINENFFVEKLYPMLRSAQCANCHNDNGVASAYGIEFPGRSASREQIVAFSFQLGEYVDRADPELSPLLRKPTERDEHTGGMRIVPGTEQEVNLRAWVRHLANMSADELSRAQKLIEQANQWSLQPLSVRRLTHSQYNNTVRDLLGDNSQPANRFPKEDFIHGFKNQLEGQSISPLQAEAYSEAAERLARSAFRGGDPLGLMPRKPSGATDSDAAQSFIRQFGLRSFRRPLSNEEIEKYLRLFLKISSQTNDFYAGAQLVVEAMLQSPNFLFRIQRHRADSTAQFEIASRLSYLLWDTMPDEAMLQAAADGGYSTLAQIEAQARRMLADPRATVAMDEFLAQWMRFDSVLSATRDRRRYRQFNIEVAAAMTEETRQLFRYLVWNDQNFMEFFTADYTFLSSSLAQIYGLPAPTEEFARVDYPPDSGRAGILGHGSFLVSTSKPAETSPTARGLFVRNHFLAQEIAPPPPGVNSVLPEIIEDKPLTNRQRLDIHLNSQACSGCHRLIDPIGYGFEQYDAIGGFQPKMSLRFGSRDNPTTKELDLDTAAYIQGIENSEFSRPKELGRILASSETCQRCIVKQFFRYAFGRQESAADQPILEEAFTQFRDSNFRFRELVIAIVKSKLFLQLDPIESRPQQTQP